MTLIHEKGSELHWKDVRELVVGEQCSPQGLLVLPLLQAETHRTVILEDRRVVVFSFTQQCHCIL